MAEIRETNASIVLLGRFNPLIFQPEWLAAQKIIGLQEATAARDGGIEVIHAEVTSINLSAKKLVVESGRFSLTVTEEPFIQARDFTINCFNLLSHSPVSAVGINTQTTFRASGLEQFNRFGDILAPKAPWVALLGNEDEAPAGGLRAMVMERSARTDGLSGYVRVHVEATDPSNFEIKINVNNHFETLIGPNPATAADAVALISREWDRSLEEAQYTISALLEIADAS
jgi:hypothetical protein